MRSIKAFTLVELLLVVLILGIIASMILPQFSNASATARASMLADDLRVMRTQISVYKAQHRGAAPGYPNGDTNAVPTEESYIAHMTKASNIEGDVADPGTAGYPFGPYLREIPLNPLNNKSTVEIVPDNGTLPAAPDNSHGWIYQPFTSTLLADCPGADDSGELYFNY